MTHHCVYLPDFGGELNSCFDDKGSVRVHRHTRLPLNNKCTAIRQAHHRKHHWSVPVSVVLKSNTWVGVSNLFIRLRNRSTIFSSRAGRCWIIGSPLYETFCWSSSSFLICCLICNCDSAKEVILKDRDWEEGIKKGGTQKQVCLWTDCIPCLQAVQADVRWSSDASDLLSPFPVSQFFICQILLHKVHGRQQPRHLSHYLLQNREQTFEFWHICKCYEKYFQDCRNHAVFCVLWSFWTRIYCFSPSSADLERSASAPAETSSAWLLLPGCFHSGPGTTLQILNDFISD